MFHVVLELMVVCPATFSCDRGDTVRWMFRKRPNVMWTQYFSLSLITLSSFRMTFDFIFI